MSNAIAKIEQADSIHSFLMKDHGGRRCGWDRRQYSYTFHIPERRMGRDRRSGEDRRQISRPEVTPD